jgi:dinuclear metal center YbgI/SA1388 family protein
MITLIDLLNQLNDFLHVPLFSDYCVNGMQVQGKHQVKKIATAVSCSLNIIEEAIKREVDVLIVHHGIFWDKESPVIQGIKREKLAKLLKSGISLLAYHLPLDAHKEVGNNWKAAIDLGWQEIEPFYKIGVRGKVLKGSRETFQKQLEDYYGQKAVTALGGKEHISSCALISGGAYRQLSDAAALGIDCFITGNFDEPAWHIAHEEKINFYALGHASTEKIGPRALADYIRRTLNLDAVFIDEMNPF